MYYTTFYAYDLCKNAHIPGFFMIPICNIHFIFNKYSLLCIIHEYPSNIGSILNASNLLSTELLLHVNRYSPGTDHARTSQGRHQAGQEGTSAAGSKRGREEGPQQGKRGRRAPARPGRKAGQETRRAETRARE